MTPEQRRERARKAANSRWSRPTASAQQSLALREAVWKRFETQVDPDGELAWEDRHRLAERALKAHMAGMRLHRLNKQAQSVTVTAASSPSTPADEWFTVGQLAKAMNRQSQTIRQWERQGIIPPAPKVRPGNQNGQRRLYSRAHIEGMKAIAEEEGVLLNDRREIAATNFTPRVFELFERLADQHGRLS